MANESNRISLLQPNGDERPDMRVSAPEVEFTASSEADIDCLRKEALFASIRRLIDHEASLSLPACDLAPDSDLFALGFTSYSGVRVLLALGDEFGVEIRRHMLKRENMNSVKSIVQALCAAQCDSGHA